MWGEGKQRGDMTINLATLGDIEQIVRDQTEENLRLEFKRKSQPDELELSKDDRRNLGEALSGFANAVGGTLVIGVGTARHQGIDRADATYAVKDVESALERYRSYASQCVSPPIANITFRSLIGENGSGVIVIDVPRGQARPHMSTAPGHHTYYRRVSDSFTPMQHYEVEEMMRLKTSPELRLVTDLRSSGSIGLNRQFSLLFGLENISNSTARFPFISYLPVGSQPSVAQYGLDGNGGTLWRKLSSFAHAGITFAAGSNDVIHPGQAFFVSKLDLCENSMPGMPYWPVSEFHGNELLLKFQFGCEDLPIRTETVTLTKQQILATPR